jgi:hypothetical protein
MYNEAYVQGLNAQQMPHSGGAGGSGDTTVLFGGHVEASVGYGWFSNSGWDGFFSHGESLGPLGMLSPQNPQNGENFNPSFGAYSGASPSLWFSNAMSAKDLCETKTTYSFNVGLGLDFGLSLSTGNGFWIFSVSGFGPGEGLSVSSQRTTTYPLK